MKRAILFVGGLLFAAVTHAVTLNWSEATSLELTRDGTTGAYSANGFSIDGSKDFAIKVALTFNAEGDANWFNTHGLGNALALLTLGTRTEAGTFQQIFSAFRNKQTTTVWGRDSGSNTPDGAEIINVKAGTYDLVFVYDASSNQMEITYDGTLLATVTGDLLPADGFGTLTELCVGGVPNSSGGFGEGWQGVSNPRSWSVESVQVLPEPTVLALLALGVAGAVLRRKVA